MQEDKHETPMQFRVAEGQVTAVFVTEPADVNGRYLTCYARVGQHGSCAADWVHRTRPAKPEEYALLLRELEGFGYCVKVVARRTKAHRQAFDAEVRRLQRLRVSP